MTTDIIVGYPGETEDEFQETFRLMEEVAFDDAYIFKFSPRPGTDAMGYRDDVSKKDKEARNLSLLRLQETASKQKLRAQVGEMVEVLVEGMSKKDKTEYKGRTRTGREVVFRGKALLPGDLVSVEVESLFGKTLLGARK